MNRSTLCEIKYMNGLFFFSMARYMIGVGFKILALTPVPKLPPPPPPPPPPQHGAAFAAIIGGSVFHSLAIHSEMLALDEQISN